MKERVWGLFNSSQLHAYFRAQGDTFEREYVFEPWFSGSLKPFLAGERPEKVSNACSYTVGRRRPSTAFQRS